MISVKKLNKFYHNGLFKKLHVINNTTIEIPSSGIIAVIGKSGVGKSTLLNAISGLDRFKNGTIDYDGTVVKRYIPRVSDRVRMEKFGFIFQNYYLLKEKTVYENVVQTLDNFELSDKEKKERVNYVLKQLNIAKYTNKLVKNLSGGEQQRVSIARALVKSPKVIFADEPTGSLDEKTTFTVLNILKKISKQTTIFIVTHEKELISYYADYIIELEKGTVINEYVPEGSKTNYLAVDQNIYLNELDHVSEYSDNKVNLNIYAKEELANPINIDIAITNGKIFLQANENIHFIDDNTEVRLIKDDRYQLKDYVDDEFDYHLDDIKYNKASLKYKNALKKGIENFKTRSIFKTTLRILLILLSALLIYLVDNVIALQNKDLSSALTMSKGSLVVEVSINDTSLSAMDASNARKSMVKELIDCDYTNVIFSYHEALNYEYEGFFQYAKQRYQISSYEFRSLKFLDPEDIVYGKYPELSNEIVVDEYTLLRFMRNSLLNNVIDDFRLFVGKTVTGQESKREYVICGISRTKNPAIYGSDYLQYSWSAGISKGILDLETFKKEYPQYSDVELGEGEALFREGYLGSKFGFVEKGTIPASIPLYVVIRDEDKGILMTSAMTQFSKITVETDGSDESIAKATKLISDIEARYIKETSDGPKKTIIIKVDNVYQKEYDENTADIKNIIKVISFISIAFGAVSLIFIIIASQKSLVSQISEIAIFRSLGYPKSYTATIYIFETIINIFIHVIIGGLAVFGILSLISIIPIFEYSISIDFGKALLIILGFGIINCIIGIIPIMTLLHKSPTQIYNTYNRKIES